MKIPESARVAYKGAVDRAGPPLFPHAVAFSAAMMSLKVLMGLGHDTYEMNAHNRAWRGDRDYLRYLFLSGEGFRFLFDAAEYFRFSLPEGDQPVRDCFAITGTPVEILPRPDCARVVENLAAGYPALLLGRVASDRVLLATGYENGGDVLVAWTFFPGGDMTNKSFSTEDCQFIEGWREGTDAALLVRGDPVLPADAEIAAIYRRALARGAKALRAGRSAPYGTDVNYYDDWIARLKGGDLSSLDPAIWDLAERRMYLANFFEHFRPAFGQDALHTAFTAGDQIHSNMWRVHALAEENRRTGASVHWEIIEIIRQCRALDLTIADDIEGYLGRL
jgi:hypothetical protein